MSHLRKLAAMRIFVERWQKALDPSQWPEMIALLDKFSVFVRDYIKLLDQIPPSVASPRLIATTGLDQLYHEWSILSRASEQRLDAGNPKTDDALGKKLGTAQDRLTRYFDRWQGKGKSYLVPTVSDNHRRVVIYFDKVYAISRSVYAPEIPVISIPLTDYESDDRWQAMAHEAGHHFYWNALDLDATDRVHEDMRGLMAKALTHLIPKQEGFTGDYIRALERSLRRIMTWERWTEEVFADIAGTLLAGPTYVVSAQDLASEQVAVPADFALDDGEHPTAYLRPLICMETLRWMAQQTASSALGDLLTGPANIIGRLEARWAAFCSSDAGQQTHRFSETALSDLATDIGPVVRQLLEARIWPQRKRLMDLVDFFGRQGLSDEERAAIEAATSGQLPLTAASSKIPFEDFIQKEPEIPESLQGLWDYLQRKLETAHLEEQQLPVTSWHLLLALGLSEDHHHDIGHTYWDRHWFLGRLHKHDFQTGQIIYSE